MTRVLIWVFKIAVSLAMTLPNQEQRASNKQIVEQVNVQSCKMYSNYSDCNTFKSVESSEDCLL
ncbi:hypothetical protein [Leeuwenhoekiella marinoflava]|uniref:Uncharacterized protein n=2 Tax=Leeuwenhoekiella marinoflava TaxID=988 RepID=A0A4Q0PM94_9FLAO|nr:hypothetical protein [Leeuwenhoekiella marinoflava]RXG30831.1 hypothetical protein DSL99_1874 [Leeuwenhoekiella marinoflava]SHF15043.1 hypothetical protein SAMN02745246_01783 [Leeuwenhoekiella marinoflava DSM 3653]